MLIFVTAPLHPLLSVALEGDGCQIECEDNDTVMISRTSLTPSGTHTHTHKSQEGKVTFSHQALDIQTLEKGGFG